MKCSSWLAEVGRVDSELWQERFAAYMRSCRRSEMTICCQMVTVRQFLRFLADRGLSSPQELQRQDVEAYQVSLEYYRTTKGKPLTLLSKNGKVSVMKSFVKFLRRAHVLMTDPARDIVCPRPPRTILPDLPTEEHIAKLLETPDVSTPLGLRDRAVLELFYSSALRNSELRLLQVGDVDFGRLQVRVYRGKGGRGRIVPVGETAAAWVEEYLTKARAYLLGKKEHGFLFVSFRGQPFKINRMGELVTRVGEAAKLPMRITPHVLRHCCATHMLRNRVRFRHLQEFLGHATPSSTQIYTRVEISDLKEAHRSCHPRENLQ
jgi:integrase/recombinase XerD